VRSFPRTVRRRILAATLAAAAVGGLSVPVAYANDHSRHLKQQQKQAQAEVKSVQDDLDESSQALQQATKQLAAAKAKLASAQAHLADVNGQLATAQQVEAQAQAALTQAKAALAQATADLKAGQDAVDAQRDAVKRTVLSTYTAGDPALRELGQLLDATSPADIVRQLSYGRVASTAATNTYQALQSAEVVLKVKKRNLAAAEDKVAADEQIAADHLTEVQELQRQAAAAASSVATLVSQSTAATAAAKQAKQADEKQLAQAKAEEHKITQKILAEAAKHGNKRNVSSTNGMFQKPVANTYITSPYGWRIHPIYHYWGLHDGDDFHAPCGVPEVAVGTGRVVSQYYSSVWGNRLFLDLGTINGDQYTAIYNHISQYKTKVGQVVDQGQTVALAGTTGWSTACHLHFTIMKNGNPINPMSVLG
jgi:murein DD-endopeptidase MepM/ murein hydrolase activator NlpD